MIEKSSERVFELEEKFGLKFDRSESDDGRISQNKFGGKSQTVSTKDPASEQNKRCCTVGNKIGEIGFKYLCRIEKVPLQLMLQNAFLFLILLVAAL